MRGMIMVLDNKIALVTGASRGIGQGVAHALAKAGACVIGTATTEAGAQKITEKFQENGMNGYGFQLNVLNPHSMENLIEKIKSQWGNINILINNAAVTKDNLFLRMKEEEWSEVIETNLTALFRLTKLCIRDMLKARWGRVINIGSVAGSIGNPGQANYAATKAAIIGFSKSIALEVSSRNITINVVSPGFISTDMTAALTNEQREVIFERIPMQRAGTCEEVAAAVLFLASPHAGYITGQTLHVNGGMYMS